MTNSPQDKASSDKNNQPGVHSSSISIVCRICYDNDKDEELITPCNCKGTVAFVHRTCLETWLGESNTTTCELCHQEFKTERTPKYTSTHSIWHWCRTSPGTFSRGVRSDILACTIITPLAIVITYVCLFSSEYYSQKKFVNVPAARWTSVSLLVMIGIMLIGYYMWVYSVIRMHARLWYNWWQRTCDVRYIPPSTIQLSQAGEAESNLAVAVPKSSGSARVSPDTKVLLSTVQANSEQTMVSNSSLTVQCSSLNINDEISFNGNDNIV